MLKYLRRLKQGLQKCLLAKPSIPESGIIEVKRLGLHWCLNLESYVARILVTEGIWEPDTTKAVHKLVKPGMHVLDIGANFGYYTLLMAQQVGPSGHVWAFEPVAAFREQLEWHIHRNRIEECVTVLPYGLSDREETIQIAVEPSSATIYPTNDIVTSYESIQLNSLDVVANKIGINQVDFIKLDIDGHEPHFLRGAYQLLSTQHPIIALEFAQHCLHVAGSDVREQARIITDLGYIICKETTLQPYSSEMEFLMDCGNFKNSGNVIAFYQSNCARSS